MMTFAARDDLRALKQAANLYMTAIRKFNRVLRDLVSNYLPCEGHSSPAAIDAELLELQKALAAPGTLQSQRTCGLLDQWQRQFSQAADAVYSR